MTIDISGFGVVCNLVASNSFSTGIVVTQFAGDADPIDNPANKLANTGMGVNGDMTVNSRAETIKITLNVIPGSENDKDLATLAEANRAAKGKVSAQDVITATIIFPSGESVTLIQGAIVQAPLMSSIASSGAKKSKAYMFEFENRVGAAG